MIRADDDDGEILGEGEAVVSREKSIKVKVFRSEVTWLADGEEIWIPRGQIHEHSDVADEGDEGVIVVGSWWVRSPAMRRRREVIEMPATETTHAGTKRGHHCHVPLCHAACPPRHLMCAPCWASVPEDFRREVYATVKLRDMGAVDETWAPWWRAQARAIAHVRRARSGEPDAVVDRYLARELAFADELEADAELAADV